MHYHQNILKTFFIPALLFTISLFPTAVGAITITEFHINKNNLDSIPRSLHSKTVSKTGITVLGLNWGMGHKAMVKELISRGYKCGVERLDYQEGLGPENPRKWIGCHDDDATVKIHRSHITYNCNSVGVCGLDKREIATRLVEAGVVSRMEYGGSYYNSNIINLYCGIGQYSDEICAGVFGDSIMLIRGDFPKNKKKPSFK